MIYPIQFEVIYINVWYFGSGYLKLSNVNNNFDSTNNKDLMCTLFQKCVDSIVIWVSNTEIFHRKIEF